MLIHVRSAHVALLAIAAACGSAAQSKPDAELRIVVLEGEGSINNIREHTAHAPVIRVVDAKEQPVAGATVNFLLPDFGASGYFQESRTNLTTTTDKDGRAAARGLRPNNVAGRFQVRVSVSSAGRSAALTISQINVAPATARSKSKTKYVIAVIAAGGAAGAALALKGGGKSSSSPSTPGSTGTTITAGSPVFGAPR
jgi:hypothetical protein